uniref:Uncharacterized protein n=1 Tax=Tetranychus urticae TaxID=32264 RepID=T1K1R7_TETUR
MDVQFNDNFIRRKWRVKDDVVISGISGRFPKSESVDQFLDNLFNSTDMMSGGNERFPAGSNDFPYQSGQIGNLNKFDAKLFQISDHQADLLDPQLRKLLEVSYEAIIDSGLDVDSLRGTNTGFFYGSSFQETDMAWGEEPLDVPNYRQIYTTLIPYIYDLKGPICHFDTACGSSFAALNEAFTAIKSGLCDKALVAGYNICLVPVVTLQFRDLQMVSRYGRSKCLDESADGYGRSEGVCCILLQKSADAKRIYSTIVNCRSNTDGYKDQGISFPSVNLQRQLMYETYTEVGLDPTKVSYVEAHTTGTQAGDPVEMKAIHDVFCINRDKSKPLMIGCLKSNMGHSEAASGLCATIKANCIFQKGLIPGNLHFSKPNPRIEGLMNETIVPVNSTTPFEGEIISLNCFGFGGANVHVILKGHNKKSSPDDYAITLPGLPRLINIAGRSNDGVHFIQNFLEKSQRLLTKPFLGLFNQYSKTRRMPVRGYTLVEGEVGRYKFTHFLGDNFDLTQNKKVYLTASNNLMNIDSSFRNLPVFSQTIDRLSSYLQPFKVNLSALVYREKRITNPLESIVTSIAIQLGMINLLESIKLPIEGVLTRSIGSLINLYLKNSLSEQKVILIAYWFGHFIQIADQTIVSPVLEVQSSWDQIKSLCSPTIRSIKESDKSCLISGPFSELADLTISLKLSKIPFKYPVQSTDCVDANDSHHFTGSTNFLLNPGSNGSLVSFKNYLIKQILYPDNYIKTMEILKDEDKTSVILLNMDNKPFKCSKTNNELALNQFSQYNLSDISRGVISGQSLFSCLGQLYSKEGLNYCLENLYQPVNYPVPVDTLSLHSLIKFDHSNDWKVFKFPEYFNPFRASTSVNFKVNLANAEDWYLSDHKIDGRILYPATGLLMGAWHVAAKFHQIQVTRFPVEFRDIKLIRATVLPEKEVKFTVQYLPYNGTFAIIESGTVVATGKVFAHPNLEDVKDSFSKLSQLEINADNEVMLGEQDIYKELRVRGYDYGPSFRCLNSASSFGLKGTVKWCEPTNTQLKAASIVERTHDSTFRFLKTWITFTDSALQLILLSNQHNRDLYIPTGFESLVCDPTAIMETINCFNKSHQPNEVQKADSEDSNKKTETLCPEFTVTHDPITQTLSTNGLWVKGLFASDTNRRNQSVSLESYDFIPFNETSAVDEMTQKSIERYSTLIYGLIAVLKQKYLGLGSVKENEIESLQNTVDLTLDQHSFANYLLSLIRGESPSIEITKALPNDLLIGSNAILHSNQRFLRPFVVTAAAHECYAGDPCSKLSVVEINDSQGFLVDSVRSFVDAQSLGSMKLTYNLVRSSPVDQETADKLSGTVNTIIWNLIESEAPSQLGKNDLVIYKLTNGSVDQLIKCLDKIYSIMKPNGNLLILTRETSTKLTDLKSTPFLGSLLKDYIPNVVDSTELVKKIEANQWICMSIRYIDSDLLPLTGLMFKKAPDSIKVEKHKVIHVNPFEYSWLDELKSCLKTEDDSLIWLTSKYESDTSVIGLVKCLSLEPNGQRLRCIALRPGSKGIDLTSVNFNKSPFAEIAAIDCKFNVFDDKLGWGDYCHLEIPSKPENDKKCLTVAKDAYIQCLTPGDLSSLVWTQFNPVADFNKGQSLVQINYSSLNFKDVMHATGRLPSNLNPDWRSQVQMQTPIGLEYAGVDANGNRVMGMLPYRALATKVVLGPNDFTWPVPSSWSLEDAATVPVVYATAIYALLIRGQLREGESVLIHAGTGGVGLAAINIALSMNCRVFTTIGSEEKRAFLEKHFPSLDATSFAHSRSTSFEEHVLRHTNGYGVDVVLNSLSEDKLLASVRCLAPGGRFLEIDSFIDPNGWVNGKKALMEQEKRKIDTFMEQGIARGTIRPLPRKVFEINEVEKAFRFMATGKHIGKVLIKVKPENDSKDQKISTQDNQTFSPATNPILGITSIKSPQFHPNKVYIIVGGFGGFGLELACWLVRNGARHLVLNSRSGPKSAYHHYCLKRFAQLGVQTTISEHNLTNQDDCYHLFEQISSRSIGGIFNCALVLSDALMADQNEETYEKVCSSKVKVTRNLDQLTRTFAPDCDYFVVFSSVACGRGNPGQTNYGLANSYMESICQERHKDGLHGLAIQWGFVGDVGFVVEKMGVKVESIRGTAAQRIHSCFSVLSRALAYPVPVLSSLVRSFDKKSLATDSGDIIKSISHILGIKDINSLDPNITLGELGMDSLMAIEVQQVLEKQFNISINSREIRALKISKLKEFSKQVKNGTQAASVSPGETNDSSNLPLNPLLLLQIPTKLTHNLNEHNQFDKSTSPVYYLPPIEGNYDLMQGLIDGVKRPVIGLNWTYDLAPFTSLEAAAIYMADQLTKLHQSDDKIDMLGYSFGGLVAFAVSSELENRYLTNNGKGPIVSRLVLIDSDPETLKHAAATLVHTHACNDSNTQEVEFIKSTLKRVMHKLDVDQFDSELKSCPNRSERFAKFKTILLNNGLDEVKADSIVKINELTLQKGQLTLKYKPKIKSHLFKICHIRAKDDLSTFKNVTNGIRLGTERFFNGNHHTVIAQNLDAINKIVDEFFTGQEGTNSTQVQN